MNFGRVERASGLWIGECLLSVGVFWTRVHFTSSLRRHRNLLLHNSQVRTYRFHNVAIISLSQSTFDQLRRKL